VLLEYSWQIPFENEASFRCLPKSYSKINSNSNERVQEFRVSGFKFPTLPDTSASAPRDIHRILYGYLRHPMPRPAGYGKEDSRMTPNAILLTCLRGKGGAAGQQEIMYLLTGHLPSGVGLETAMGIEAHGGQSAAFLVKLLQTVSQGCTITR
jgi:hypothetical protein